MSTPNFYYNNCLQVFDVEDDFDFDSIRSSVQIALLAVFKNGERVQEYEREGNGGLRSYPGNVIFRIPVNELYRVDVVMRSGYYSGGNIDWSVVCEDSDSDASEKEYENAEAEAGAVGEKVTSIISPFTTKLICRAVFSNGEAIYEKV